MIISGLMALCFCVFWPVTGWYIERLLDKSDEPLGVVSLIAFIAILLTRDGSRRAHSELHVPVVAIVCFLLYAVTWPIAPKLLSAIIAVVAIGCLIDAQGGRFRLSLGSWLLLLFSLPIVSSLNFYSGYPLRLVVGKIAAPLISMVGFPTIADGTALIWNSQMIQIDAPCSGIKMLWFALFIGAVLTASFELSVLQSAMVLTSAVLAALLGNVLRITSLFFIEAKILPIDPAQEHFIHQAVGAVAFAIAAGGTVLIAKVISKRSIQVPISSESNTDSAGEKVPDFAKTVIASDANAQVPSNGSESGSSSLPFFKKSFSNKRSVAFIISALIAAVSPLAFSRTLENLVATRDFPGWPHQYRGATIEPVSPSKADIAFYQEFPGKIQCFSLGAKRVIIRWVAKPTRQLHPSSDCFRGVGYDITWQPLISEKDGSRWSSFIARKGEHSFVVKERIYDGRGESWTDISSWYWAALLGKTHGPWWSDVEITPIAAAAETPEAISGDSQEALKR